MTQVKLSAEEQIINALSHVKRKPHDDYTKRQFDVIREVLRPMYEKIEALEDEQKVGQARQMAIRYASLLSEKLEPFKSEDKEQNDISVKHLLWMCSQICDHTGYVPQEWSITKLHRWIGYIQGVMVARDLTTVLQERNNYREMKKRVLSELNVRDQDI